MNQNEAEHLRAQGLEVETIGDILGATRAPVTTFIPEALEGTPPLPAPGIYFGMDDATYHALPALSAHGIKKLAASPMLFWAGAQWLNPKKQAEEKNVKPHFTFGKAYHCRIMEGKEAYEQRYAIALDPADWPDALESTDQIKAAIGKFQTADTRKTASEGDMVPVKPVAKVPDLMPDGSEYLRSAVKADWIAQLIELDPSALIFANMEREHRQNNAGKTFLTADQHAELEIAALMVERDPEIQHAFKGGHAEVVLIWECEETGVPLKCKVDYLKLKAMVDLKSISNQRERSIEQAIRWEIASYHYNVQPCLYVQGAKVVRQLIRDHGASVVYVMDLSTPPEISEKQSWALKWAQHREPDEWLWVFQVKGDAPITRGVWFPLGGTVNMITREIVSMAKRRFRKYSEEMGVSPWLDISPTYMIADEDIPNSACEI